MASKKYHGKACSYCDRPGISIAPDHVLARKFCLEEDRQDLPQVPVCGECNTKKSALETYALTVLPLGSRHVDARKYSEENVGRRLQHNAHITSSLRLNSSGVWEQATDGLLIPVYSLELDQDKIRELVGFIVRGLFRFHYGEPLNSKWIADATIIRPEGEEVVFKTISEQFGPFGERVSANLGRGTFIYQGYRSHRLKWISVWRCTFFDGLQFGNGEVPDQAFATLSVITRPDMTQESLKRMLG
jgi:hypothetical protein